VPPALFSLAQPLTAGLEKKEDDLQFDTPVHRGELRTSLVSARARLEPGAPRLVQPISRFSIELSVHGALL
jgi:hypothetical protein